jgi:hypothetical protein
MVEELLGEQVQNCHPPAVVCLSLSVGKMEVSNLLAMVAWTD